VSEEARTAFDQYQRALRQSRALRARVEAAREARLELSAKRDVLPSSSPAVRMTEILDALALEREAQVMLAEANGQAELAYVALLVAEGDDPTAEVAPRLAEPPADPRPKTRPDADAPKAPKKTRGLWVWRTSELLDERDAAPRLVAAAKEHGLNEIYLSVPRGLARNERLPAFVRALRAGGLSVDALIGEATWYRASERSALLQRIEEIASFNARTTSGDARFSGIHLDIEPHRLKENKGESNRRYLPELVAALRAARETAQKSGLSIAADVPRKLLRASAPEGLELFRACPRLFLMLYELEPDQVIAFARGAFSWAVQAGSEVVVGLRGSDFTTRIDGVADAIDRTLAGSRGYAGLAIHDYAALREEGLVAGAASEGRRD
jgi:hypothetical protein